MKIKLIFAWYDFWIGLFYDKKKKWIFFLPIPMLGVIIKIKRKCPDCKKWFHFEKMGDYCGRLYCYKCKRDNEYFDDEYR